MAVCPEHWLLSRRLLRSPWTPQMVSHPPVYDFEGRLDCRGLYAYGLGAAGPAVRHSGTASVGVGVCGHHGVRIDLHAFQSDHIFWGGDLALLWQILRGTGFPNQFFCDSWVVGFWRGRPWLAGRRIGETSLDVGSSRFWIGWVTKHGDKCARSTCRD